jgi:cell division cycle 20-like protein 1 (cofactor of APC complex)
MDVGASDRFIPSRATSSFHFNLWDNHSRADPDVQTTAVPNNNNGNNRHTDEPDDSEEAASNPTTTAAPSQQNLLNTLLRSELLGENVAPSLSSVSLQSRSGQTLQSGAHQGNHFRFQSPRQVYQENIFEEAVGPTAIVNCFSLMPIAAASQRLLAVPSKRKRRISKVPFKVLDAPALQDDFYLNLVDWSSQNVLAVGLGSCVYLWSACTSKVTKLCDLVGTEDTVTSVSWAQRGTHLAVGTNRGEVQLWDTIKCKRVRSMPGHTARVGTLAWTGPLLASGSRDRLIYLRDVRTQAAFSHKLNNHKQEVCGLKWSYDEPSFLASGGNDNHLHVIDSRFPDAPIHEFTEHSAAVKAIAWSPHQHGLLASGGGTADRCIRFFNTLSGASLNKIDTGSQVCNLAWSQNVNEIVSTHGYSLNQIVVWRYPSMTKVATLTGHTYRVLYLSVSPDGSTIVTGAGDETLRFWQVFPGPRSDGKESSGGLLFPQTIGSVIR